VRDVGAVPDRPHLANNLFRSNDAAVYVVAGRDGSERISTFVRRDDQTSRALQTLTDLIHSKEVLPVELRSGHRTLASGAAADENP